MTNIQVLKRDVEQLKRRKPPTDIIIEAAVPFRYNEPHGIYGHQRLNMTTQECSTVPEDEEVQRLTKWYHERVPKHAKRDHASYSWATLQEFLLSSRCHCGHWGHE